ELVGLFDLAYETTMVMLFRIFASTDGAPHDMAALQMAVFFPMMTTVLRPLGEVITRHPVAPKQPELGTAGPRFWFDRGVALLPAAAGHRPGSNRRAAGRERLHVRVPGRARPRPDRPPPASAEELLRAALAHAEARCQGDRRGPDRERGAHPGARRGEGRSRR